MMSPLEPSCDGVPYDGWRILARHKPGRPRDGLTGGGAMRQAPTAARSLRRLCRTDHARTGTARQLPVGTDWPKL